MPPPTRVGPGPLPPNAVGSARLPLGPSGGSWAIWDWYVIGNGWLDRVSPTEVLRDDPTLVQRAVDGLVQV